MRILLLSQFCYPEPEIRGLTLAKALKDKGNEVQILTGLPNYPGGKIYDGYKLKLFQREVIDGIEILRVPLYPDHGQSSLKRILNYISFAFFASVIGVFKVKKADAMYVWHPPATTAIPALMIQWFRRIPAVYDVQDIWPDTLEVVGMLRNKFILKGISIYSWFTYKWIRAFVVQSPCYKTELIKRGVREDKIDLIHNWSHEIHQPVESVEHFRKQYNFTKFTVLFAGNMGKAQALDKVFQAAELLKNQSNIEFVFIGGGVEVENLKALKESLDLHNVRILDPVPSQQVGGILKAADALIVHLIKKPLFKLVIPSKTQAYMRTGKPILMGVEGCAAEIVQEAKAGVTCEPENPQDIADKVIQLSNTSESERVQMGENGKRFYEEKLAMDVGVEKMLAVFRRVAKK